MKTLYWLGFIWALPNTLLGFIILLFGLKYSKVEFDTIKYPHFRVMVGYNNLLYRIFTLLTKMDAFTCGCMIFYCRNPSIYLIKHEQEHIKQNMIYGIFNLPLYCLFGAIALLRGKHPYRDNYFEILAVKAGDK